MSELIDQLHAALEGSVNAGPDTVSDLLDSVEELEALASGDSTRVEELEEELEAKTTELEGVLETLERGPVVCLKVNGSTLIDASKVLFARSYTPAVLHVAAPGDDGLTLEGQEREVEAAISKLHAAMHAAHGVQRLEELEGVDKTEASQLHAASSRSVGFLVHVPRAMVSTARPILADLAANGCEVEPLE